MKNLELQNYGVATLSTREMRDTNGGVIPVIAWYVGAFVVGVAVGLYIALK